MMPVKKQKVGLVLKSIDLNKNIKFSLQVIYDYYSGAIAEAGSL